MLLTPPKTKASNGEHRRLKLFGVETVAFLRQTSFTVQVSATHVGVNTEV